MSSKWSGTQRVVRIIGEIFGVEKLIANPIDRQMICDILLVGCLNQLGGEMPKVSENSIRRMLYAEI